MAYPSFPYSPLPIGVELTLSSGQHDITDDVDRAGISITRGRSDESGQVGPGSLKVKLRNDAGQYSPRNPTGTLYGLIGRNTPVQFWAELGAPRAVQRSGTDYWATSDKAALDVTGDLDVRVDIRPSSWRPAATTWLGVLKFGAYGLLLTSGGYLQLLWNDSSGMQHTLTAPQPVPAGTTGRKQVRATLEVNTGAGSHAVRFYVWSGGAWVLIGSPVIRALTTSIINSTGSLATYANNAGQVAVYEVQVRNGIGGTLVANPVFTSQASGTTSFSDGLGNTWLPIGDAKCWNRHYRVNAEMAEWPARWSEKGSYESFVEAEGAGVLRRLQQGAPAVKSPIRMGCEALPNRVGYWPCEDGADALTLAGGVIAAPGLIVGPATLAAYDGITASLPLPTMSTARLTFHPPPVAVTGATQIRFMLNMPTAPANGTVLARLYTTSTAKQFDLVYNTGDSLTVKAYTAEGSVLGTLGPVTFGDLRSGPLRFSLELAQSGSYVNMKVATLHVGSAVGGYVATNTSGECTLGATQFLYINPLGADLSDTAIGHVTVENAITSLFDLAEQLVAYDGEDALTRIARVADENGIDLEVIGSGGTAATCGPQSISTALDIMRETAGIDGGVLYEPDTGHDLAYRSLDSLTTQTPPSFAYVENMFRPFEPTEDDRATRNDVTVSRSGGTEYRAIDSAGPLGVDVIGRYDDSVTLNLHSDDDAREQAGWRLNLGTVDDLRWPQIGFNLADPRILADPDLVLALLELEVGDRLELTGLPEWLPPFPADVIVQGVADDIAPTSWQVTLNTSPAQPYDTVEADWESFWDNETTTLSTSATAAATTLSVTSAHAPYWTHADGDYDLVVGGEVVTVTGVSGTGAAQTLTVTRAVNGVVKAHAAGETISLYRPARWNLS